MTVLFDICFFGGADGFDLLGLGCERRSLMKLVRLGQWFGGPLQLLRGRGSKTGRPEKKTSLSKVPYYRCCSNEMRTPRICPLSCLYFRCRLPRCQQKVVAAGLWQGKTDGPASKAEAETSHSIGTTTYVHGPPTDNRHPFVVRNKCKQRRK